MRDSLLVLALFGVLASALFADKVTVDPNAPGAAVSQEPIDTDAPLAQKVTYEARRQSLVTILADLSKKTGVTLKAGYNSQDWQVRDRRMNVFCRDVPAKDLMQSISRVMKFKWSRAGTAPNYTYRLYMDRKTLLDEETKRLRDEEKSRQEQIKLRTDTLTRYGKLSSLSPAELDKLKEEDPFTYFLTKGGVAQGLGAFFNEVPAAAEALASGQEFTISAANLPAGCLQSLISSIEASEAIEGMMSPKKEKKSAALNLNDPAAMTITINEGVGEVVNRPENNLFLGMIGVKMGEKNRFMVPFLKPDSKLAAYLGRLLTRCVEEGKDSSDLAGEIGDEFVEAITEDAKQMNLGEPIAEHSKDPDDPDLRKKFEIKGEKKWLTEVEADLCDATGLAIVSESFERSPWVSHVAKGELEVGELVGKIATSYIYNWQKHGTTVEFRDRNWYRKRLEQIPQAWIDRWAATLKKTGTLDLPDLVQIAALTQVQLGSNLAVEEVFSDSDIVTILGSWTDAREVLRLYGALAESQRTLVLSPGGLDTSTLTAEQWTQLTKLAARKSGSLQQDAHYTLSAAKEQQDKRTVYVFKLTPTGDAKPMEWKVMLPAYNPKKEEPKTAK